MAETMTDLAVRMYGERRRRARFVPRFLLTDHAWDILLWVFIANRQGRRVSLEQVCEAADASEQAARRWLTLLRDSRLLAPWWGSEGADDNIMLSDEGFRRLDRYLAAEMEQPAGGEKRPLSE